MVDEVAVDVPIRLVKVHDESLYSFIISPLLIPLTLIIGVVKDADELREIPVGASGAKAVVNV